MWYRNSKVMLKQTTVCTVSRSKFYSYNTEQGRVWWGVSSAPGALHTSLYSSFAQSYLKQSYFTDAETVYSFSCYYRFRWQLFIKRGFQWSDLMLIYLHYPAISWVSIAHLTLYTLQGIKETYHLLFFKCSWNDNLYLWVGKGCSVSYWNQTTE